MYRVDRDNCIGCGICADSCPSQAIRISDGVAEISDNLCDHCGNCFSICPQGAIYLEEPAVVPAGAPLATRAETSIEQAGKPPSRLTALVNSMPLVLELALQVARILPRRKSGYSPMPRHNNSFAGPAARSFRHRRRGGRTAY